ncbi:SDR family NAD(P)-dependent oxidoreductase [Criblamydia sequanensis]|uniref:Short-chain dehydrogenase/reductase n=1 Tax=Candidatus Criblamydia sequanensis CRIB-18 TaxID=1437425 RepID=A0A090D1I1_9BACT|nr:SDR family NAD(P)-dependent oxidoreductase [Criblamydia sequanensis]CDR33563.1 Short-chain dehydrogenase/reductase [Criblamydia sequanensis CRIB-18]
MEVNPRICLITGANSGIGKAVALQFARLGIKVIIACRNEDRGKQALREIQEETGNLLTELMIVDLSSMSSIRKFSNDFQKKFQRLDVLIHNGANFDHTLRRAVLTEDGFETIFATNYLGPFLMTRLLLPCLFKSSQPRLLTVGTKGLDFYPFANLNFDDLDLKNSNFTTAKAYYNSKLALLMFTINFANRFKGKIDANCIRVTNVAIGNDRLITLPWYLRYVYFIKRQFSITPEQMSKIYITLALSSEIEGMTGLYWDENNKIVNFPSKALNGEIRERLWNITEDILGVSFRDVLVI